MGQMEPKIPSTSEPEGQAKRPGELRVSSISMTLETRVAQIEEQIRQLGERLARLEALREREILEKAEVPAFHRGKQVIGKIPIWGSGRSLIVMKTGPESFELDVV